MSTANHVYTVQALKMLHARILMSRKHNFNSSSPYSTAKQLCSTTKEY